MVVRRVSEYLRTDPKYPRKRDLAFRDLQILYVILVKQLDAENEQKLKLKNRKKFKRYFDCV